VVGCYVQIQPALEGTQAVRWRDLEVEGLEAVTGEGKFPNGFPKSFEKGQLWLQR